MGKSNLKPYVEWENWKVEQNNKKKRNQRCCSKQMVKNGENDFEYNFYCENCGDERIIKKEKLT